MKILNKLTIKHLTLNKKRTITTIIGICLSTALMVGIGLLCSTVRDSMIKSSIKNDGRYTVMYNVPSSKLKIIESDNDVKDYYYYYHIGYHKLDKVANEFKPYIDIVGVDKNFLNELTLLEGRLPRNNNEVVASETLIGNSEHKIKVGDKLTLNIGDYPTYYTEEEVNVETTKKEYTVVGINERYVTEAQYAFYSGYQVYTLDTPSSDTSVVAFVNFKSFKNAYKKGDKLTKELGLDVFDNGYFSDVLHGSSSLAYNDYLISMYGESRYENIIGSISGVLAIILSLISIGCIMVIYNSFAISVMERKKQFGLFASIGTTRKQLRHTVFFEALIVGTIGIILGIISAYIGIGTVILIVNNLLKNAINIPLELCTYPLFIIIPVIFMIITIILSAFIPARRASRVSPIRAIKQNDDIRIKGKKVKTNKLVRKIFGMEGELALKNIKRNKKKYRITIVSLFISIVLFISFSSVLKYVFEGVTSYTDYPDYKYIIDYTSNSYEDGIKKLNAYRNYDGVKESVISLRSLYYPVKINRNVLDKNYIKNTEYEKDNDKLVATFISISNVDYNNLLKKYNKKDGTVFVVNNYSLVKYTNNSRKKYQGKIFNTNNLDLKLCDYTMENCDYNLDNIVVLNEIPFGIDYFTQSDSFAVVVSQELFKKIESNFTDITYYDEEDTYSTITMLMNAKSKDLEDALKKESKNGTSLNYINVDEQLKLMRNLILVIKILLYGFISLVTLIGVTSVFNTINTSINLRRKEFAMLRSVGLSPRGFNKILSFESIFFGFKSLLYSIPVSIAVSYLIYKNILGIVDMEFKLPIKPIIISILAVFIIVFITMRYSARKIKKENILEAIREENI